jgi:hypothetical protein
MALSAPKKSGKTALAAVVLLYVVRVVGGRFAESYCVANDLRSVARPGAHVRRERSQLLASL